MKSLPIFLFATMVSISVFAQTGEIGPAEDHNLVPPDIALECQSKKVFDAGFFVQITNRGDKYSAQVVEIFGWSPNLVRFSGPVFLRVTMNSMNFVRCQALFKSIPTDDDSSFVMIYNLGAEGAIHQLNNREVSARFGTLVCTPSPSFAEKFRECF